MEGNVLTLDDSDKTHMLEAQAMGGDPLSQVGASGINFDDLAFSAPGQILAPPSGHAKKIFFGICAALLMIGGGIWVGLDRLDPEPEQKPHVSAPSPRPPQEPVSRPPANPYWNLPESLVHRPLPLGRRLTNQEAGIWTESLQHKYLYQHYRAVEEMRAARLAGSAIILRKALTDKKFWTRMQALLALAEMGDRLLPADFAAALGNANSELVARYMERFDAKSTDNEVYCLAGLVRFLDERGRVAALTALERVGGVAAERYKFASLYDHGARVQVWRDAALRRKPLPSGAQDAFMKLMVHAPRNAFPTNEVRQSVTANPMTLMEQFRQIQVFGGDEEPSNVEVINVAH